jgi:hypothetical protein
LFHVPAGTSTTKVPGLSPVDAVNQGIIHPKSATVTGPAQPGPALPAKGKVVLPVAPSPAELAQLLEHSPFVSMARALTTGFMQANSPGAGAGGAAAAPSSGGGGSGAESAPVEGPPPPVPPPGSTKRGLILAGVVVAGLLLAPLLIPREVRA